MDARSDDSLTIDADGQIWPSDNGGHTRETCNCRRPKEMGDICNGECHSDIIFPPVDVVIPARNEADTIGNVVTAFRDSPRVGNIIVVCNQCEDNTAVIATLTGVFVIEYNLKLGKGQAITHGLNWVESERVIFCDADLTGPLKKYVTDLVEDNGGMTIGVPDYPKVSPVPWPVPYHVWCLVSGIRCLPTKIAREETLYGYTVEVMLNRAVDRAGLPVEYIRMEGVYGKVRQNSKRMEELRRDREWLRKNW